MQPKESLQKWLISCMQGSFNQTSDIKKGEPKKVQVIEQLKSVKSLWGKEEKIYQQGCIELQHTKQVK